MPFPKRKWHVYEMTVVVVPFRKNASGAEFETDNDLFPVTLVAGLAIGGNPLLRPQGRAAHGRTAEAAVAT